jgi:hypothetical protein
VRRESRTDTDEQLADQVASLAERLARGESQDVGHLETVAASDPETLERLVLMMRLLSDLADEDAKPAGMP